MTRSGSSPCAVITMMAASERSRSLRQTCTPSASGSSRSSRTTSRLAPGERLAAGHRRDRPGNRPWSGRGRAAWRCCRRPRPRARSVPPSPATAEPARPPPGDLMASTVGDRVPARRPDTGPGPAGPGRPPDQPRWSGNRRRADSSQRSAGRLFVQPAQPLARGGQSTGVPGHVLPRIGGAGKTAPDGAQGVPVRPHAPGPELLPPDRGGDRGPGRGRSAYGPTAVRA